MATLNFALSARTVLRYRTSIAIFFRLQALYLSVAAVGAAILWAFGQQMNPATIILYSLCGGNLTLPPMNRVRRLSKSQPFRYKLLIFLAALFVVTPIVYVISSVIVGSIAPPSPQTIGHLITTGWKFPMLVLLIFSVVSFLYVETKERLERRNKALERSVQRSVAKLELQEQELQRGREIQESLLPKDIPQIPGFDVATAWQPARMVGGDYFDVLKISENQLAICIADVSGKGISAALLMANVQATVRAFARESQTPANLCNLVNSVLCGNIATGKFVTFFCGVLDAGQRTLQYCNAGHPGPILVSGNATRQLPTEGAVLGVFPGWKFEDATIDLGSGDRLLLFTDGISEAEGPAAQEFGEAKLAALARDNHDASASAMNNAVIAQVTEFCNGHFQDDLTLMVIAVN